MTAFQELQAFAQALSPFCQANGLRLICPHSVPVKDLAPGTSVLPCLVLAQAAEDLTSGHVMPTAERGNLFIPVRTPFAASATLKFVNLRSYTLTLAQESRAAGLRLDPAAAARPQPADLWDLLALATAAVVQAELEGVLFLQAGHMAPLEVRNSGLVVLRSEFSSGTHAANVLPPATGSAESEPTSSPVMLHLL